MSRSRHSLSERGDVVVDTPSSAIDGGAYTKAVIGKFQPTSVNDFEASPDGGATWYKLFGLDGVRMNITSTGSRVGCYMIPMMPKTLRVTPAVVGMTDVFSVDLLREIA